MTIDVDFDEKDVYVLDFFRLKSQFQENHFFVTVRSFTIKFTQAGLMET